MTDTYEMGLNAAQRALENADRHFDCWSDEAKYLLLEFACQNGEFMTEDVRDWAHSEKGLPKPPTPRAWGGIVYGAARQGLIRKVGIAYSKKPPAHASPKAVWIAA